MRVTNKGYQGPTHIKRPILGSPCLRCLGVHGNSKAQMHTSHDELIIEPYAVMIATTTIQSDIRVKAFNFLPIPT